MRGSRALLVPVVLLLAACSSPTAAPDGPGSPSPGSPSASPSAAVPADAPCRVAGFVGRTRVEVTGQQVLPVYAAGLALAPGTGVRGPTELQRVVDVRPGVRVQEPERVSVDPALLRQVATTVRDSSTAPLPTSYFVRRRQQNTTGRDRTYAQYAAARFYRGRWSARVCGGPTNDGTEVTRISGTFLSVGRFRTGVLACSVVERREAPLARQLRETCDSSR
ncbi:hypothetical protein SAMN04488570_1234 [Nocardioides scoriae]|uniref:Lipoprotein n=1 Tax=Nocardioides scoriae TaxID=642780 RepID=A0A1H1PV59_9ACTN|nr:hypothetical protein [Nocardioides scoriae]SDS14619.1 hypothetical protein SAMN04488570_1234 [Nocardioides scoriae]